MLDCLDDDPNRLDRKVDWVIKRRLIEFYAAGLNPALELGCLVSDGGANHAQGRAESLADCASLLELHPHIEHAAV